MKSTLRILFTAASLAALVVMLAPAAKAQCIPAQIFASKGLAMAGEIQLSVDVNVTGGGNGLGNEIGRFWLAGNSNNANNFAGNCPSTNGADAASSWWTTVMDGTHGIEGVLGGGGTISPCEASSCPTGDTDELIVLVEDYDTAGPPGVGGTAYFLAWRVDPTFADNRTWNYARVVDLVTPTVLPFVEYPAANVLTSSRGPGVVNTQMRLAAVDAQVDGKNAGGDIADTATVVSWDICTFHGGGDPGRLRTGWDSCSPVAYTGATEVLPVVVDCPNDGGDTYVAIGATFQGGAGGNVASALVGKATMIECDPNLADPDNDLNQRPKIRPRRGVGRSGR